MPKTFGKQLESVGSRKANKRTLCPVIMAASAETRYETRPATSSGEESLTDGPFSLVTSRSFEFSQRIRYQADVKPVSKTEKAAYRFIARFAF